MNEPQVLTKTQFAAHLQVAKSYVSKLAGQGRLVLTADGLVDVPATKALLRQSTGAPERAAKQATGDEYAEHRERREKAMADLAEMDAAERRGQLVLVEDVRATVSAAATALRAQLEGLADQIAPQLAATTDENTVRNLLAAEVERILADMAHSFSRVGESA